MVLDHLILKPDIKIKPVAQQHQVDMVRLRKVKPPIPNNPLGRNACKTPKNSPTPP